MGKTDPLVVENGSGVTIKLKLGTHQLLMTPQCLLTHSEPVTINVVVPAGPRDGGTAAPGSPGDPGTRPGTPGPNTDIPLPGWVGAEVTGRPEYKKINLQRMRQAALARSCAG